MERYQLQIHKYSLKAGDDTNVKTLFKLNDTNLVAFFKNRFQIFDIMQDKLVYTSSNMDLLSTYAIASDTSFIFSAMIAKYPQIEMFDLKTLKRTKYASSFHKRSNQLFLSGGFSKRLFLYHENKFVDTGHQAHLHIKFNGDSISMTFDKSHLFGILRGGNRPKYTISKQFINRIIDIKEYSNTQAIINIQYSPDCWQHQFKHSILIFSLPSQSIIRQFNIYTLNPHLFRFDNHFFSLSKSLKIQSYQIQFQPLFDMQYQTPQNSIKTHIGQNLLYFSDNNTLQIVSYFDKHILKIQQIKLKKIYKKNLLIHLMQQLGIIKEFQSQIVKKVIDHFYDIEY